MIWDDYIPTDDETAAILAQCKLDGSYDNTYGDSLDFPPWMARTVTMPLICPGEPVQADLDSWAAGFAACQVALVAVAEAELGELG
jgi:hypothetical protein